MKQRLNDLRMIMMLLLWSCTLATWAQGIVTFTGNSAYTKGENMGPGYEATQTEMIGDKAATIYYVGKPYTDGEGSIYSLGKIKITLPSDCYISKVTLTYSSTSQAVFMLPDDLPAWGDYSITPTTFAGDNNTQTDTQVVEDKNVCSSVLTINAWSSSGLKKIEVAYLRMQNITLTHSTTLPEGATRSGNTYNNIIHGRTFIKPTVNNVGDRTLHYESSNTKVAKVDAKTGDITWGKEAGEARISVYAEKSSNYLKSNTVSYTINTAHEFDSNNLCACGAGGEPTLTDGVYQIANAGNLVWFSDYVNTRRKPPYSTASAVLTVDIDLSPVCHKAQDDMEEKSWTSIANASWYSSSDGWTGTFDGAGHSITGLYIHNDGVGLFGYNGGTIKNLHVDGDLISTFSNGGMITVTNCLDAVIQNCSVSGTIWGFQYIGGIAGINSGSISDCSCSVTITTTMGYNIGGIVGYGGRISQCVFEGKIIADEIYDFYYDTNIVIGGLAGEGGNIQNCVNLGTITAKRGNVGGFAGYFGGKRKKLQNNLNLGTVSVADASLTHAIAGFIRIYDDDEDEEPSPESFNNYYLDTSGPADENATAVTAAQLASGEVAYLLNGSTTSADNLWVQNLDNGEPADATPMLKVFAPDHGLVYAVDGGYSNSESTTPSFTPGDANGDGSVTITDALAVVYHVLNKTVENFDEKAADMDGSGDISITDALAIVKAVLGGNSVEAKKVSDELEDMLDPQ